MGIWIIDNHHLPRLVPTIRLIEDKHDAAMPGLNNLRVIIPDAHPGAGRRT
jgi:hypothetical protein